MTDDARQLELQESAARLLGLLALREGRLRHLQGVHHAHHSMFAGRVSSLGQYLHAALSLAEDASYPPAYALLRAALDHQIFDRLLFLASRYQQIFPRVDETVFAQWNAARPRNVVDAVREASGRVRIVWEGIPVHEPDGRFSHLLSIYYSHWQEHDPFVVPARDYEHVTAGHPQRRDLDTEHARLQGKIWDTALAWKSLKENLVLNSLATRRGVAQLDVHHRFLSAYTHPTSESASWLPYRNNALWFEADHYAQELVLLYVATLAVDELRDFERMSQRDPRVEITDLDEVQAEVASAEARTAHFWAPGRQPYAFDRVTEANQRAWGAAETARAAGQPWQVGSVVDPATLSDEEIRYYANPLRRLIRLHSTFQEGTTGLYWISPWPRADARYRS